ncbi:MAG: YraN family protein [Nannocystaceae bacterium]
MTWEEAGSRISTRARGGEAERHAATFLEAHGLEIVDRNVTVGGVELDLVARQAVSPFEWAYVFVEVRSRARADRGTPAETVGHTKRARLVRGATAWLTAADLWERVEVRFDVVGVTRTGGPRNIEIEWIPAAFDADPR